MRWRKSSIDGTFGDRTVLLTTGVVDRPRKAALLFHGVHSSSGSDPGNKYARIGTALAENGVMPILCETSRRVRNRHDYVDRPIEWIFDAFRGKTYLQELEDCYRAYVTPHPKEFDRLAGGSGSSDGCNERLEKARELARHIGAYIILKGHYSALCQPDGTVYFNPTGNPGMATAGSGDVLTGIITGLCARGYKHNEACKLGMYLHGLAGDLAARDLGQECMVASDIINYLPKAFKQLEQK